MTTRAEYDAAKEKYHEKGRAYKKEHSEANKNAYDAAKADYHAKGRSLKNK
jgi:hypothetical protein